MTSDELEAARLRHPSAGGPPPAFIAAAQAVYGRRERHARHLAESTGMSIEAARGALLRGGLGAEVIEEHDGLGVWWCTTHNDGLDACTTAPLAPPWCAPVYTTAPHCAGCHIPEDQPHRPMCARVMGAGDPEGDVLSLGEIPHRTEGGCHVDGAPHLGPCDPERASVPEAALLRSDVMNPDTDATHLAALGVRVDIGRGPETELCGAQLDRKLTFCTKAFGHVDAGDDVHYDHRAKVTWRVAASL